MNPEHESSVNLLQNNRLTNSPDDSMATLIRQDPALRERIRNSSELFADYNRIKNQLGQEAVTSAIGPEVSSMETEPSSQESLTSSESRLSVAGPDSAFPEIRVLRDTPATAEKTVRVYRGVSDTRLMERDQVPYAMRTEYGGGSIGILKDVEEEVAALAENPGYATLTAYKKKVEGKLNPAEAQRLRDDIAEIEDAILNGENARDLLVHMQIRHGGGNATSGLTPYVSATLDPREAADYGKAGVIAMDIPLSMLSESSADGTEVRLNGVIGSEYITAIIPRNPNAAEAADSEVDIARAVESLPSLENQYSQEELQQARQEKIAATAERDVSSHQKDVEQIWRNRIDAISAIAPPELAAHIQVVEAQARELGANPYEAAKSYVYDSAEARLEQISQETGRSYEIDTFSYVDPRTKRRGTYTKEALDDAMVKRLMRTVQRVEGEAEELMAKRAAAKRAREDATAALL